MISKLLEPTIIYTKLLDIITSYKNTVLGIAHITGGGFSENIPRILPNHLTYKINKTWKVPEIFEWIQIKSGLTDDEMMRTFNCGIGAVLVMKKTSHFEKIIKTYNLIEIGYLHPRII